MSISFKPLRTAALGVATAAALMVVGVSSASAALTPAAWSAGGQVAMQGSLTLSNSPTSSSHCTNVVWRAGTQAAGPNFVGQVSASQCTGGSHSGTLALIPSGAAWKDGGSYYLKFQSSHYGSSPFGAFGMNSDFVPFTNGSGSTPSKLTFNNTHIGAGVRATGTLNVALSPSGGLVTLN